MKFCLHKQLKSRSEIIMGTYIICVVTAKWLLFVENKKENMHYIRYEIRSQMTTYQRY